MIAPAIFEWCNDNSRRCNYASVYQAICAIIDSADYVRAIYIIVCRFKGGLSALAGLREMIKGTSIYKR